MITMANSPFTRPTSVMSLLADQMQLSSINEMHSDISSSAPIHRYSVPDTCFNCLYPHNDVTLNSECRVSNESDLSSPQLPSKRLCHSTSNDGIARPIPIKVNIHDTTNNFHSGNRQNRMSCPKVALTIKTPQRNIQNSTIRPIISPHYKKSAFTPTRSQASPQTTSSDYSISPDMESPIYRPASVTSSGFHDFSQQSLLIDPNHSPDSNQKVMLTTTNNSKTHDPHSCLLPRCHSQPCDEPVSRNFINRSVISGPHKTCNCHIPSSKYPSQIHTPMKRRYPSLSHIRSNSQSDSSNMQTLESPTHCHCNRHTTNSADASPSACGSLCAMPKRDCHFFGSGRSYLISLPRIASSPPPVSLQVDPQCNVSQAPRQRIGSNSSSLSTSTTTDTNTPTVIFNGVLQQKLASDSLNQCYKDSAEDINMDESLQENRSTMTYKPDYGVCYDPPVGCPDQNPPLLWADPLSTCQYTGSLSSCSAGGTSDLTATTTSKSYSTNSNCTNISLSIDSDQREPDDPPEIGFCFSQLTSAGTVSDSLMMVAFEDEQSSSSFQELDLDQIELD